MPPKGWCLYNERNTSLLNGANHSPLGLWLIRLVRMFPSVIPVIQADSTTGHASNLVALLCAGHSALQPVCH